MEMYCSLVKCSNEEIVRTLFDKHGKGAYLFPLIATLNPGHIKGARFFGRAISEISGR